jgi:hypothetical protein
MISTVSLTDAIGRALQYRRIASLIRIRSMCST